MLAKTQRLTVAAFNQFFKRGRRTHGTYVTLVHTPHPAFKGAVVVGKKVYKHAVDRNRLRRQLYPVLARFNAETGATGVYQCLVKPAAAKVNVDVVRAEFRELLAATTKPR